MSMPKDNKTIPQDAWDTARYYEELDTTDFPVVEPNVIKKLRQRKAMAQKFVSSLSNETLEILCQHNTRQDHKRLDAIIQAVYAQT